MTRRDREHLPTSDSDLSIVISDDGSRTLKRLSSGVTWHSESGALPESRLVFLHNSAAIELFRQKRPVRILEVGFGTGLNFWITASKAIELKGQLQYIATEPDLLDLETIKQLQHSAISECHPAFEHFFENVFSNLHPAEVIVYAYDDVELKILQSTIQDTPEFLEPFDIVFHDPFSPDHAPELWSHETMKGLYQRLKSGGRLVTYCVKSSFQRTLRECGFEIEKTRGPDGGKREVLIAHRPYRSNP